MSNGELAISRKILQLRELARKAFAEHRFQEATGTLEESIRLEQENGEMSNDSLDEALSFSLPFMMNSTFGGEQVLYEMKCFQERSLSMESKAGWLLTCVLR